MVMFYHGLLIALISIFLPSLSIAEDNYYEADTKELKRANLSESRLFASYLITFPEDITPNHLQELHDLSNAFGEPKVTQLISRVAMLSLKSHKQLQLAIDNIRRNLNVEIEPNFAVSSQAAGPLQQVPATTTTNALAPISSTPLTINNDPLAPVWYTDATRITRHPQSLLSGPVAHDETKGNEDYVTIHTIDTNLSRNEIFHRYELKAPSRSHTVGGYGQTNIEHGTYVSYIAHGKADNGIASHGICQDCDRKTYTFNLSNVSGLQDITSRMSDVLTLFTRLRNSIDRPANVVNMSWGLPFSSPALRALMVEAEEWGVHMVAAVGNEDRARPLYPADFPQVIAVGATGVDDGSGGVDPTQRAIFTFPNNLTGASNRGPDLVAPGYKIPIPNMGFQNINWDLEGFGTSFATPHVSGALGLIWSYFLKDPLSFPQAIDLLNYWPDGTPHLDLVGKYFREVLERSAKDIAAPGFDDETGHGLINVNSAFELLRSDAADFAEQISTGLTHGVQEWDGNFGGTILAMLQQRFAGNPETKFVFEDGPYEYGSCWQSQYNYIRIQTSRPRFFTKVRNFSLTPISVNGDIAKVRISYNLGLDGYVRFKVKTIAQCVFWLPGVSGRFDLDWSDRNGTNVTTLELELKLDGNGYKVQNISKINPPLKDLHYSAQLAGFTLSQRHLDDFKEQLADAKLFLRDILEPTLDQDLVTMTERAANATLFQERNRPFTYFHKRAGARVAGDNRLRLRGVSRDTNFDHASYESLSSYSVANPVPEGLDLNFLNSAVLNNATLVYPQATHDSASNIGQNIFNVQLAYLYNSGAFEQPGMGQAQVNTGTRDYPQGLSLGFSDANFFGVPYFFAYPGGTTDNYGELNLAQSVRLTIGAGSFNHSDDAVVVWSIPFKLRDLHREIDLETDGSLNPVQFEQRFVPNLDAATLVIIPADQEVFNYISQGELEEAYRRMVGMKYLRVVSSLSSHRMAGEAQLGDFWGCTEHLLDMINFYSKLDGGKDLVDHVYSVNCFDLNIGYFRPTNFESATPHNSHIARGTDVELRYEVDPTPRVNPIPDLNAGAANRFDTYNHLGQTYTAAYVGFAIGSTSANSEVNYSYDGMFRTQYKGQTNVRLVEQLWQWGPGDIWVPNLGQDFKVLALAREDRELVVSSVCNQEVKVRFQYNGTTPPTITQRDTGKLIETTVFETSDLWSGMDCGNHGDPSGKEPGGKNPHHYDPVGSTHGHGEPT